MSYMAGEALTNLWVLFEDMADSHDLRCLTIGFSATNGCSMMSSKKACSSNPGLLGLIAPYPCVEEGTINMVILFFSTFLVS